MQAVQVFPPIDWFIPFAPKKLIQAAMPAAGDSVRNQAYIGIRGPNGLQKLNIPFIKESIANEPLVASHEKWKAEFLNSIATAYGTAPFFEYYFPELVDTFSYLGNNYFALCRDSIRLVSHMLGWQEPEFYPEEGISPIAISEPFTDYGQRFTDRYPFTAHVSVLDLVFNCGPVSSDVLAGKKI
jgi:hypothetical protein